MKKSIAIVFFLLGFGLVQAQYVGGDGRGDVVTIKNAQAFTGENVNVVYAGGNGRGDALSAKSTQAFNGENINVLYAGASGRGDVSTVITSSFANCINATWNGSMSDEWENAANWSCNAVPGLNSIVIIPSGVLNYPTISISTEVKSIAVRSGATITVKTGVALKLNGQ